MTHDGSDIECDLLVIGAGMAGMTAASTAAAAGARVLVLEKSSTIGGSAALSSGYLWTTRTSDDLRDLAPEGDPKLQDVVVEEFESLVGHVAHVGAEVGNRIPVLQGIGNQIDVSGYMGRCRSIVESHGGNVVPQATVERLVVEGDDVVGAVASDPSVTLSIKATDTLIATGGFARSPDLLSALVRTPLSHSRVRCAPGCTGDGLRFAQSVGGATSEPADFYGHLVGLGVDLSDPARWDNFTLLHSRQSILVDSSGHRFVNEALGDNVNAIAASGRGDGPTLLAWDEEIHQQTVLVSWPPGYAAIDKFEVALEAGGTGRKCANLAELGDFASRNGIDGGATVATIRGFNDSVERGQLEGRIPLTKPPFYALLVEAAVTFPYAGIRVDDGARVLSSNGSPIGGFFAAGADVGRVYGAGYGGGLALAGAFSRRAMRTAGFDPA